MIDVRCKACGKLLGKFAICIGAIKCTNRECKMLFEYKVVSNIHLTNAEDPDDVKERLQELNK